MKNKYLIISISLLLSIAVLYFDTTIKKETPVNKKNMVTINMYRSLWPGLLLVELGNRLGYFKDEGIIINQVDIQTTDEMFESFKNNKLDAASEVVANLYPKIYKDNKSNVQIVIATDYSNGADAIVKRKGAPSLLDSTTKTFAGVDDYQMFVPYVLDKVKAKRDSIKYVDIPSDEEKIKSLLEGKVDYAITYEPYLSKAIAGGADVVYSSSDDPGIILDAIIFRKEFIAKNPETVNAFVRAYFKAYNAWRSNPRESYILVSKFLQTSPLDVENSMKRIVMLGLDDNIQSMSTKQGLLSVYNNLQESRQYTGGGSVVTGGLKINDMVYPDSIRKIKREYDSGI